MATSSWLIVILYIQVLQDLIQGVTIWTDEMENANGGWTKLGTIDWVSDAGEECYATDGNCMSYIYIEYLS